MLQQHKRQSFAKKQKVASIMTELYSHLLFEKPQDPLGSLIHHLEGIQKDVKISIKLERERIEREKEYHVYRAEKKRKQELESKRGGATQLLQNHFRHQQACDEIEEQRSRQKRKTSVEILQSTHRTKVAREEVQAKRTAAQQRREARQSDAATVIQHRLRIQDAKALIEQKREEKKTAVAMPENSCEEEKVSSSQRNNNRQQQGPTTAATAPSPTMSKEDSCKRLQQIHAQRAAADKVAATRRRKGERTPSSCGKIGQQPQPQIVAEKLKAKQAPSDSDVQILQSLARQQRAQQEVQLKKQQELGCGVK